MQTIGIIGLGLIGGSLARAIKTKKPDILIIAYDREEKFTKKAKADGVIDHATKKIDEAFAACNIIFICVPVGEVAPIAEQLKKHTNPETIVTDVGSTKSDICEKMRKYKEFTFIGGHPMAGSEQSGYAASKHYLFENAYYPLTPFMNTDEGKIALLTEIITEIGALPLIMDADTHDFVVGGISHVPHVIAMALVNAVAKSSPDADLTITLASGGFKDITRVASSSPKMWNDISFQNKENILKILSTFKEVISGYENSLISDNEKSIYSQFESAKTFRDEFTQSKRPHRSDTLGIDLEDKPGGIAFIAAALAYHGLNIKNLGIANNRDSDSGILEITFESSQDMKKAAQILSANGLTVHE